MSDVVLFVTDGCYACRGVKAQLSRRKIPYEVINITGNFEKIEEFKAKNWVNMPILKVGEDHFVGPTAALERVRAFGNTNE